MNLVLLLVLLLVLCGVLWILHLILNLLLPLMGAPLTVKPIIIGIAGLLGVLWCLSRAGVLGGTGVGL